MKRTLLFASLLSYFGSFAQVGIEPFDPATPGTYIGDFEFLSPGDDIPSGSAFTEEGDVANPNNMWTADDGSVIAGFAGGSGNWASGTCDYANELFLVSPEMNFGTATTATTLTFSYIIDNGVVVGAGGWFSDLNLDVYYKTSAGGAWNLLATYATVDNMWHDVAVDLDGAADYSTYYLGFRIYGTTSVVISWGYMGLDDIVVEGTDGSPCSDSFVSFSASQCESYTVPSGDETYSADGTYNDTIPNAAGCDSVMTITLDILESTTATINANDCDSYTVPSGDETYSISGTYMDTIPNSDGCDSVLTINLTIGTPDVGVTLSGITLTADATGVTYQWLTCPGMAAIAGETNQDFTPNSDGDYAVIITDGTCVDTSACMTVTGVGIEKAGKRHFALYPNPANQRVFVDLTGIKGDVVLEFVSMDGKVCLAYHLTTGAFAEIPLSSIEPGVYSVRLSNAKIGVLTELFVKQ